MPFDKTSLPAPPEFPASNASYNKIVGNMHKAVLGAGTCEAAIAAVTMIASHVGGVNTYAKAARRYGDRLIEALNGLSVEPVKAAAKTEKAAAERPAMPQLAKKAAAKVTKETGIKVTVVEGETFSDKSNARRALKRKNLDHLPVTFEPAEDGRVRPVVTVSDDKGIAYAAERGIKAKVAA